MLVFGTELHIVTFLIIVLELVFFFYQFIHYLSRPSDKNRLYYLILLYLLIQYNLISGLLPDKNIPIKIPVQNIMAFAVAFIMGMYFPFYFYKVFKTAADLAGATHVLYIFTHDDITRNLLSNPV